MHRIFYIVSVFILGVFFLTPYTHAAEILDSVVTKENEITYRIVTDTLVSPYLDEELVKRTPNSFTQDLGVGQHRVTIFAGDKWDESTGVWKEFDVATTTEIEFQKLLPAPELDILGYFAIKKAFAAVWNPGQNLDTVYHYYTYGTRDDPELAVGNAGGYSSDVGLRFQAVTIPECATIDTAKVSIYSTRAGTGVALTVDAEDIDDAPAFVYDTSSPFPDFENRAHTTASASWTLTTSGAGVWYDSPAIPSVIQEVVDRVGWASGNDLAVFIKNNSSATFTGFESYQATGTNYPYLTVTYTDSGCGGSEESAATSTQLDAINLLAANVHFLFGLFSFCLGAGTTFYAIKTFWP